MKPFALALCTFYLFFRPVGLLALMVAVASVVIALGIVLDPLVDWLNRKLGLTPSVPSGDSRDAHVVEPVQLDLMDHIASSKASTP